MLNQFMVVGTIREFFKKKNGYFLTVDVIDEEKKGKFIPVEVDLTEIHSSNVETYLKVGVQVGISGYITWDGGFKNGLKAKKITYITEKKEG